MSFNINDAIMYCKFSDVIYYGTAEYDIAQIIGKKIKLKTFENAGSMAGAFVHNNTAYIIFRGTEPTDWRDIIADINAFPTDADTKGSVHRGFKNALDYIHADILLWMRDHVATNNKIVITGHSLGGAMANIFTSRLVATGLYPDITLYTYGSPRTGSVEWAKQFDDINAYRIVNNNDIVCAVPPFGAYSHVGQTKYLDYYGKIHDITTPFQRLLDRVRSILKAWSKGQVFTTIYDHLTSRYIEKLKVNLQ